MFTKIRQQAGGEGGFTLIELLVVILIVGILAAIAIPSFLSQKNKAYSAQAEELARSVATALETYATTNNGEYTGAELKKLHEIEPTIPESGQKEGLTLSLENVSATSYKVKVVVNKVNTGTTPANPEFGLERTASGEQKYPCAPANIKFGCPTSGEW
jgi:prepilin-type N-terminal cleavage/methylation domain-containing protein